MGWLGNAFLVVGLFCLRKNRRWPFLVTAAGELLWTIHSYRVGRADMLAICAAFLALQLLNWFRWGRAGKGAKIICAYCEQETCEYPVNSPEGFAAMRAHAEDCNKHPMAGLRAENDGLRRENGRLRAVMREHSDNIREMLR